jgi:LacI family transcriptional regulator
MAGRRVPVEVHTIPPVGVAARQSTDVVAVADERVAAAVRYIRQHATTNLRVADVLRAVPMSRTLLERRFRRSLGCTPHEHIARTRLEHVKSLLAGSDLSITEIADRMEIEHVEYLSAAFRRETGQTPGEYRALHRRGGGANQRA